ncbi:MAG: DUF692 domain-containing protein [Hydrogenophaga sp.]|uniref:DUF692 domain-containing protein n=1 Tax=Hydrogenophaga sp. TaxID=1904254 RepID=UPI001DDFF2E2|nr:DUF692 domain-containing protein [Hydrogenophaga sp.]MBX3610785.1 DUF692 domain-containing protein [Hydrogenophaga sp.]
MNTPQAAPPVRVGIGWRTPHQHELLARRPALDFIEVHAENFFGQHPATLEPLLQAREHHALSLHGVGLSLGSAEGIDGEHLDRLAALVQATEPEFVSDHACFARGLWHGQPVHATDLLPVPFTREALDAMAANVARVQDRLRRPIAVENLSAYLNWPGNEQSETDFLMRLCQRTGCRLLVDVNNLYVNALNDQRRGLLPSREPHQAVMDWLDAIDADCVSEIHLAGHHDRGDIVIDDHGSRVIDPVWSLYRHAIERFGAMPTLIEWDTDVPALDVLLDEAASARRIATQVLANRHQEVAP